MKKKLTILFAFAFIIALSGALVAQPSPIDFEPAGVGGAWTWMIDQNGDNPALEVVANPASGGLNTSANVAKFTARDAGQDWALCYTDDIGEFVFDETNCTVKILVHKPIISDVGVKFEGTSPPIEIKVANTVVNEWEELTFDFSGQIGNTYNRLVIIPDFAPRDQDNVLYFDNMTFSEALVPAGLNAPVDFEPGGNGADWTWIVDQNGDNPALEVVANPASGGLNTSANVAKFTARDAGQDWALVITDDIGKFVFDETNCTVKLLVHKPIISDVGVKFEGSSPPIEIKIANTVVNEWEELTFDFSGQIGNSYNRLVIIPDFAPRDQDNVLYFDNMTFSEVLVPAGLNAPVDFEAGGNGADWTWIVDQNGDNPALEVVANPASGGLNTSANVAKFTARDAGQDWALVITDDIGKFVFDETNCTVRLLVHKPIISDVGVKFEGTSPPIEIKVANTVVNEWEELTFDFSGQIGNTYNRLVIIPDFAPRDQDNVLFFDNMTFSEEMTLPVPTVAAPTPTAPASNVISLFSNAYTNVTVDTWSADWDQADVADVQIAGDDAKLYTNFNYAGIEFTSQTLDVTSMTHFHMDIWTPDPSELPVVFRIKLVDFGANGTWDGGGDDVEHELVFDAASTPALVTGEWVSFDIPLTDFTGLTTKEHLAQLIISSDLNTVYVDNIYLHSYTVSVKENQSLIPTEFVLEQNYPNPFNPTTKIRFSLPEANHVTIKVYSMLGQEVATLMNEFKNAGTYNVVFDAAEFTTGTYIYSISAGDFTSIKKMVLIK